MNAAQIHLALNHAPLFLSVIGAVLLAWGMIRKNESITTIALYMLVAAAIFTAPVFLTGEGTEELVEKFPGVNESAIEKHEELAKTALIVIIATGIAALAGLIVKKGTAAAKWTSTAAVILAMASFILMAQTAHQGGLIRHAEIQTGAAAVQNGEKNDANENSSGKNEKDDDD